MNSSDAIILRNARKQYGKNAPILNGINLTVARGSIYGLLGASGCGKTTLLSCVVGVRKLDSGEIWVLGGQPGTKGSGIPGPRVGYMPQDISLTDEFTVLEAFYYFGRINGMEDEAIEERYAFLKDLLQFPANDRYIRDMSGGQQRRVSFGVSLVHNPELLILDEPTVGLDPVLRDNIWNFMSHIAKEQGITIIITTHYIEETKQASRIGLLRGGLLLAESSPNRLLERFQTDSLEDAFLSLSKSQEENQARGITDAAFSTFSDEMTTNIESAPQISYIEKRINKEPSDIKRKRVGALLSKNVMQFLRNPGGVLFGMLFPLVQVSAFFGAVGGDLKDLKMSVVNEEAGNCNYGHYLGNVSYNAQDYECNFVDLSCRFLNGFNDSLFQKLYYDNFDDAKRAIIRDKTIGVMYFKRNFSLSQQSRVNDGVSAPDEDINNSIINVYLDMGNREIGMFMKKKIPERFIEIYKEIMKECRNPEKIAEVPMRFETPIFGKKDATYDTFVAPAFLLTLNFFLATSLCSTTILTDRTAGVWERSLVQGVTTTQILITHIIAQAIIVIIQVIGTLGISMLAFGLECNGSMIIVGGLFLLNGLDGMLYGLLISIFSSSHSLANYAASGTFFPMLILCGIVWPIEGIPKTMRWLSVSTPLALPGTSLRSVTEKASPITNSEVYTGFLVIIGWISFFSIMCCIGLKKKK